MIMDMSYLKMLIENATRVMVEHGFQTQHILAVYHLKCSYIKELERENMELKKQFTKAA